MPEALVSDQEGVARAALAEITAPSTVGVLLNATDEGEGVTTLTFLADLSGYPGWNWSVSVAELPGEDPTVLEAELLPGPGALLAPDWVPWAERLEEYRAAQAAAAAEAGESPEDADSEDDLDDDADLDDQDDDDDFEDVDDDVLTVAAARVDEQDDPEDEPDDDGPEPPDPA